MCRRSAHHRKNRTAALPIQASAHRDIFSKEMESRLDIQIVPGYSELESRLYMPQPSSIA